MTFEDVRKIALAWPEVDAGTSYGTPALKVRRKLLVRLKEDGDGDGMVMPGVPPGERDMMVESRPKMFYFADHYRNHPMVLIRLSQATRAIGEPAAAPAVADAGRKGGDQEIRRQLKQPWIKTNFSPPRSAIRSTK